MKSRNEASGELPLACFVCSASHTSSCWNGSNPSHSPVRSAQGRHLVSPIKGGNAQKSFWALPPGPLAFGGRKKLYLGDTPRPPAGNIVSCTFLTFEAKPPSRERRGFANGDYSLHLWRVVESGTWTNDSQNRRGAGDGTTPSRGGLIGDSCLRRPSCLP